MIHPKLLRYVDRLDPMKDYLVREFVDNYEDGVMSRRDLLERVFRITGSTAAAAGVLLALGVKPALADPLADVQVAPRPQTAPQSPLTVPAGDPAVVAQDVTFRGSDGAGIMAYLARPNSSGTFPAVLICHENRGTSEHYRDVARRYAKAGYVALHLDLLSRQGGTAAVQPNDIGGFLTGPGSAEQFVDDFKAGAAYLRQQPSVAADRIGMTGFCFGGNVTWNTVTRDPSIRAAVPYYGVPAWQNELGNVRASVLGVYGELDQRVDATIPAVQAALSTAGRTFKANVYPGANHAFFNDTGAAYNEVAALAAWRDTLAWFGTYLRAGALPATGDAEPGEGDSSEGAQADLNGAPSEEVAAE